MDSPNGYDPYKISLQKLITKAWNWSVQFRKYCLNANLVYPCLLMYISACFTNAFRTIFNKMISLIIYYICTHLGPLEKYNALCLFIIYNGPKGNKYINGIVFLSNYNKIQKNLIVNISHNKILSWHSMGPLFCLCTELVSDTHSLMNATYVTTFLVTQPASLDTVEIFRPKTPVRKRIFR